MFPVKICEIHSLGRYSREVFVNRCSSAYRTPEMDTRKREENSSCPLGELRVSFYFGGIIRYGRDNRPRGLTMCPLSNVG